MDIWKILGMPPTADEALLKEAFTRAANILQAQGDGDGLARLQKAYRKALTIVRSRNGTQPHKGVADANAPVQNLLRINLGGTVTPPNESTASTPPDAASTANAPVVAPPVVPSGLPDAAHFSAHPSSPAADAAPPAPGLTFPPLRDAGTSLPPEETDAQRAQHPATPSASFPLSGGAQTAVPPTPPHGTASASAIPLIIPTAHLHAADTPPTPVDTATVGDAHVGTADFSAACAVDADAVVPPVSPESGVLPVMGLDGGGDVTGFGGLGGLIFPAILAGMDTPSLLPQTSHGEITRELSKNLCQRMQALVQTNAGLDAWEEVVCSADFSTVQYSPAFMRDCIALCQHGLTLPMATALYTVYGFASTRSRGNSPRLTVLRGLVRDYVALPETDIPLLSFFMLQQQCSQIFTGMERLFSATQSVFLWQQALQTNGFMQVRYQPYFLHLLALFLRKPALPPEFLQVLAQVYMGEVRFSPCVTPLCARLPLQVASLPWPKPELYAADLLQAGADDFYRASEDKFFSLLKQTITGFKLSRQIGPWEYVFQQPQFGMLRRDANFVNRLCEFAQNTPLPPPFWQVLRDTYSESIRQLSPEPPAADVPQLRRSTDAPFREALQRLHTLMDAQNSATAPRSGWERLRAFPRTHPWLCGIGVLYLGIALYFCLTIPLLGLALLVVVLLLIF